MKRSLSLTASAIILLLALAIPPARAARPAPQPEKFSDAILVNHVGFTPKAAKTFLLAGQEAVPFEVIDAAGKVVLSGNAAPVAKDFGPWRVGDFSSLTQPGTYRIRAAGQTSQPFTIDSEIYEDAITKTIAYFAAQRCGDSTTGYHRPCHLDDGLRLDTRKHQDVSGGWHDACDLRKWTHATLFGMLGLARVAEVRGRDVARITAEMRWGNSYFLKMQEPAGHIMNYCAGDDGNHWTDSRVGTPDDRPIHTEPAGDDVQYNFISAQAAMVRLTRAADPAYAEKCQAAALKCLDRELKRTLVPALALATAAAAACELHRALPDQPSEAMAARFADALLALQVTRDPDAQTPVKGHFINSAQRAAPYAQVSDGDLPLIALCQLLETFPGNPAAPRWREALRLHCDYLLRMSALNPFALVPFTLYKDKDPGGNRRLGAYWYRYFMPVTRNAKGEQAWFVGINAHAASLGVGLARASRLLHDPRLIQLAQRQLDWIVGVNPFDASTVEAVGRNQPKLFVTSEFRPATPHIPGGVMNGIGGRADDAPFLGAGAWQTCEYWTPMVCYTMWLMAELQAGADDQGGRSRTTH